MALISTSDVANSLFLRRATTTLRESLNKHRQEMVTQRAADPVAFLRGRTDALAALERGRAVTNSFAVVTSETALHTDAQQLALGRVRGLASDTFAQILGMGPQPAEHVTKPVAFGARNAFDQAVISLNTRLSDRYLFSGAATDRAPLISASEIIDELLLATAGATSAQEVIDLVDDWFDIPGGGFETTAFQGSTQPSGPITIAPGETIQLNVNAARDELRPTLKNLALAALVNEGVPATNHVERSRVLEAAGERLMVAQSLVTGLSGQLGAIEAQVAAAEVRNTAERTALEIAVSDLIGVDPYDAVTRLEDTRGRLDALFTITGRLQRLSLTEYLR